MANSDKKKTSYTCFAEETSFWLMSEPRPNLVGNNTHLYVEGKAVVGHREPSLSITGQTNHADLSAPRHTYTSRPASFPCGRPSARPSLQPAMRPAENKFSFPLGERGPGVTLLYSWSTRAVALRPPLIKGRSGARGGSLTRAIIKTEVMF